MQAEALLDELERVLKAGHRFPFGSRVMVDEEEIRGLIEDLRQALPADMQEARQILAERERVLDEARREAERIVQDAQGYVQRLADESTVVRQAHQRAEEILGRAEQSARDIRHGARQYADRMLAEAAAAIQRVVEQIEADRRELREPPRTAAGA
ncbi:MAG: ATPase [Firmicutes bacterium]|nr:ATPase [Bacillota bacterium]